MTIDIIFKPNLKKVVPLAFKLWLVQQTYNAMTESFMRGIENTFAGEAAVVLLPFCISPAGPLYKIPALEPIFRLLDALSLILFCLLTCLANGSMAPER